MSNSRPYTAILCNKTKTQIVEMNASVNIGEAQDQFMHHYPEWDVIAIIAGSHESRSYSFDKGEILSEKNDRFIDPFDTNHVG